MNTDMKANETRVSFGLRLDKQLMEKIKLMAYDQNRNLSNMVETLLKEQMRIIEAYEDSNKF